MVIELISINIQFKNETLFKHVTIDRIFRNLYVSQTELNNKHYQELESKLLIKLIKAFVCPYII